MRGALALAAVGLALAGPAAAAECAPPRAVTATVLGLKYCADPAFGAVIAERVQKIRADVRAQRQAGKLIVYASTPISPRGGGDTTVNLGVAASVKARLEKEYGGTVWVLDPGAYQLPDTGGRAAGGGDYMVMWTDVLGGEDGSGRDFDMVHFTGPGDMRAFFGCGREDVSGCVARHPAAVAIADPARRQAFVRYYTLRASSAYSTGAHDDPPMHEPGSRETALVERVSPVLVCDGQRFELLEGDCVTFDADLPHHFENPGEEAAVLLAVLSAGLRRS